MAFFLHPSSIIILLLLLICGFICLQLIYQRFYSTVSANDKCTFFADCSSINRRNVKADARHAYAPNIQMYLLAVKSRIIASAMKILGLKSPTAYQYSRDESQHEKTRSMCTSGIWHHRLLITLLWMKNCTALLSIMC